jgi:hypothetical protein
MLDQTSAQYNEIKDLLRMLQCVRCGNEMLEDAIICRICARVVQHKTHFSPADLVEADQESGAICVQGEHLTGGKPAIYRAGLSLLLFLVFVMIVNIGYDHLQKQNIIQNNWTSSLAFSDVFIDRFTTDDQVSVKGRLTNITDVNMQGVVIRVYVMNVVNQRIGEEYFYVEPEILLPGSAVDFRISIRSDARLVRRVKVEIYDAQVQPEVVRPILWS